MSATVDTLTRRKILMVAANPAVSAQTGWPIGFWWSELTHPYWEFTEHGYDVEVASPDGGALQADSWSDPRDESGYSAADLLSLGFVNSPTHRKLVEDSTALADVSVDDYAAVLFIGGHGPSGTLSAGNCGGAKAAPGRQARNTTEGGPRDPTQLLQRHAARSSATRV